MEEMQKFPRQIDTGLWETGHLQGIALDKEKGFLYCSYTTVLVKMRLDGSVVGTVEGVIGHLGCIDFNEEDGKVYASLELKHDSIGQGIMKHSGVEIAEEDSFYAAIFDVNKITRLHMNAEKDGIMRAAYLPRVVEYYNGMGEEGKPHRFACSGIDGTGVGPVFGQPKNSPTKLMIACGIYGDVTRKDNDCNIIMQYDWRELEKVALPLNQKTPHHSGQNPEKIYHVFTGNTTWGVQNLEYDAYSGDWFLSVYPGKKEQYPNYPTYVIDGAAAPYEDDIAYGEKGWHLRLKKEGVRDEKTGIWGNKFPYGQTGFYAFGNGYYYVSRDYRIKEPTKKDGSIVKLYRRTEKTEIPFEEVK